MERIEEVLIQRFNISFLPVCRAERGRGGGSDWSPQPPARLQHHKHCYHMYTSITSIALGPNIWIYEKKSHCFSFIYSVTVFIWCKLILFNILNSGLALRHVYVKRRLFSGMLHRVLSKIVGRFRVPSRLHHQCTAQHAR